MATINKYAEAKIYKLVNTVTNQEYVGCTTTTLTKRKTKHKCAARGDYRRKLHAHLNSVGWENVSIVLVEDYKCGNRDELNARVHYWVRLLKPALNTVVPTRTTKQRVIDRRCEEHAARIQKGIDMINAFFKSFK
jgi:hypothetical protein